MAILVHFCDLEMIFTENSGFQGASPGRPVARQAGTTPSPTLAEDVFGSDTSEYVLGGSLVGLARVGEGVVPACLATGRPGLAPGNPLFSVKIISKSQKCAKMAKNPQKTRFCGIPTPNFFPGAGKCPKSSVFLGVYTPQKKRTPRRFFCHP